MKTPDARRPSAIHSLWAVLFLSLLPNLAQAQVVDTTLDGFSPGDRVLAIATIGDTIYLGGSFLYVGPSTGGGVPVDARTAQPVPRYPRVVGEVDVVIGDGAGGWFIGGRFSYVGSVSRANLAHVNADGTVSAWAPNPNEEVFALALEGGTLFVGGDFDSIGALPRARLAALSVSSGQPSAWRCDADGRVSALVASGAELYVGGWFTNLGGQARTFMGAVNASSGVTTALQVALNDHVVALAIADTTLFVGGYFRVANGDPHLCLVAVGSVSGAVHPWNPALGRMPVTGDDGGPHVNALLVHGGSLFVAGSFTSLGGQPRPGLAELDLASAQVTAWQVRAKYHRPVGAEFWALARSGDTLFVAGEYDSLAGGGTANASALSATTGERFTWDPHANDYIFAITAQSGLVYVGGQYTSVGDWVVRPGLAAIDARTGLVTDWDPHPDDYVKSMLAWGGKIYVGGYFTNVGGQDRLCIAALDPVSGRATSWNPGANWAVWSLQPSPRGLLAGGIYTAIGNVGQRGLAAIDTSTGLVTAWNPQAFGDVYAMAVTDSAIYVGGDFTAFGGQPRASLAAVDPLTGAATPWNPGTDGIIEAVTLSQGEVYVGGVFHSVGGAPRDYLAAVSVAGAVTPWAPNPDGEVKTLASADSTVFAGGFFSGASGVSSQYFTALDARTAKVNPAYPSPDGPVFGVTASNGSVYIGGGFGRIGRWPEICLAVLRPNSAPTSPIGRELELSQCVPNPVHDATLVRYVLPAKQAVTLTVYDLQGRSIARVLSHAEQSAGPHAVNVATTNWRPGCYLYRVQAGGLSATRKMVVVR